MGWESFFLVGVIVSYVEAKKGVEDAFFGEGIQPVQLMRLMRRKAAVPFVHGTAAWFVVGLLGCFYRPGTSRSASSRCGRSRPPFGRPCGRIRPCERWGGAGGRGSASLRCSWEVRWVAPRRRPDSGSRWLWGTLRRGRRRRLSCSPRADRRGDRRGPE